MSHSKHQNTNVRLDLSDAQLTATQERITGFIDDQLTAATADGAVIALSGGIDSTLTAHLAVEALGPASLHGLVMPGEVSSTDNMSDAQRVAQLLRIDYDVIEIDPILESVLNAYPEATNDATTVGNTRARIRAVLNYLIANHENRLVLGTGNRTEILTGYFTKYGDGAVDCLPIGNLYKQQVRQLAKHLGVPDSIIEKTPTAELWAGQTDEDELGMDYDTLDAILALHIDEPDPSIVSIQNVPPADTIFTLESDEPLPAGKTAQIVGVDVRDVKRIRRLHTKTGHKRNMPPSPETLFCS